MLASRFPVGVMASYETLQTMSVQTGYGFQIEILIL